MTRLAFTTYDVFTARRYGGNPLAVVEGAETLDTRAMQTIAREFNLSETIFVLPPENPAHAARVRIFTPTYEMPFAGHPTVGCAIHLARQRFGDASPIDAMIVLEENVGPVRCAVRLLPDEAAFAEFDTPSLAARNGEAPANSEIAQALGVTESQLGFARHSPTRFSAGAPFLFAPIDSLASLASCRPGFDMDRVLKGDVGIVAYTRLQHGDPRAFRVRMFAPGAGVPEDPATGSAAAAFAGVLAAFENLPDGEHSLPLEQGIEMGRPSIIALEVHIRAGKLAGCRVGGNAVHISAGTIIAP